MVDKLRHKLYNCYMKNIRPTFRDSTNIRLPIPIYDVLVRDAFYFGFTKNGKANINGLLNDLIPCLSDYRENLHLQLLKYTRGAKELTARVEDCIYNVYLREKFFLNEGRASVSFRVSKDHYDDFLQIHDELLNKYHLDFTNYIRTLLSEYATAPSYRREQFYHYRKVAKINNAIEKQTLCRFYLQDGATREFVVVSVEVSTTSRRCYVAGLTMNSEPTAFPLSDLTKMTRISDGRSFSEHDRKTLYQYLIDLYNLEEICLD